MRKIRGSHRLGVIQRWIKSRELIYIIGRCVSGIWLGGEAQISSVGAVSPVTVSDVIVWCENDHGSWPDSTNRSD